MSDNPSIRDYRITKTYFRTCSTYGSRSQAHFYLYALRLIADQAEVPLNSSVTLWEETAPVKLPD